MTTRPIRLGRTALLRLASRSALLGAASVPFATLLGCDSVLGIEPGVLVDAGSLADAGTVDASLPTDGAADSSDAGADSRDGGADSPDAGGDAPDAGGDAPVPTGDFAIDLSGGAEIVRGSDARVTVTLRQLDALAVGATTVSVNALPQGVTADSLTIPAGAVSGVLTLHAATSAPIVLSATLRVTVASPLFTHVASQSLLVRDAAGALDVTFGSGGIATVPVAGAHPSAAVGAKGLVVQNDGQIVFCGNAKFGDGTWQSVLTRVADNGAVDPGFGNGGVAVLHEDGHVVDACAALALLPSGSMVVGGFTDVPSSNAHAFMAARFTSAGKSDPSFGTNGTGVVFYDIGGQDAKAYDMVVQPDGKLVLGGFAKGEFALLRLRVDGSMDTTFGAAGDGTVFDPAGGGGAITLELLPSGNILVQGATGAFLTAQYDGSGRLVTSYGSAGYAISNASTGHAISISGAVRQASGMTVLSGNDTSSGSVSPIQLVRIDQNGHLDTTFGKGGFVSTSVAGGQVQGGSLAVTRDGGLVLAALLPGARPIGLIRYGADGALVTEFGGVGYAGIAGTPGGEAIAVDSVGRIVIASFTMTSNPDNAFVTLARFWP